MNDPSPATAISPLRQRMIDDMNVRRFSRGAAQLERGKTYRLMHGKSAISELLAPSAATSNAVPKGGFRVKDRIPGMIR
jgi:hypothetical protein